jgi:hypothetical protein
MDILSFGYIGVGLSGLCLLAVLTFNTPVSTANTDLQKQLTISVFDAICIAGMIAGISPTRCSRILHFKKAPSKGSSKTNQMRVEDSTIRLEGHHPKCTNFSSHVLQFGNKVFCAGCTGLVTGATISLIGSFLYYLGVLKAGESGTLIFWLGFACVACGLLQYNLFTKSSMVHFSLNVIFVLGAFLLLVGVNEMNSNLVLNIYFLALIVYWIVTRMALSRLEHKKICATCGLRSCNYFYS